MTNIPIHHDPVIVPLFSALWTVLWLQILPHYNHILIKIKNGICFAGRPYLVMSQICDDGTRGVILNQAANSGAEKCRNCSSSNGHSRQHQASQSFTANFTAETCSQRSMKVQCGFLSRSTSFQAPICELWRNLFY